MENLFNKMFPLKCINCGGTGEIICDDCLYNCEVLSTQYCIICDKPSFNGFTHKNCYKKGVPLQLISIYKYEDTIRTAVKTSKYGSKQFLAIKKLAYEASYLLKEWGFIFTDYICVSVPSSKSRFKNRGFNQAEIISEIISSRLGLNKNDSIITRERDTDAQHKLNKQSRSRNVQGAFLLKKEIKGKNVLIIDDIVTTGATLKEISKILYEGGAIRVKCLTLSKKFKKY